MKSKRFSEDVVDSKDDSFLVTAKPMATMYECNINEHFEHVSQFEDLVFILENAVEGDVVKMNLSSGGGSLAAVLPLLGAMENTKAHIHCHIVSDIASACTFLPMYADSVQVNHYATIMLHNASYGTSGTGHIVKDYVDYTHSSIVKLLSDMYKGFLNEEELQKLFTGKEHWMDKEEFMLRYEIMQEQREEEMQAFMELMEASEDTHQELHPA